MPNNGSEPWHIDQGKTRLCRTTLLEVLGMNGRVKVIQQRRQIGVSIPFSANIESWLRISTTAVPLARVEGGEHQGSDLGHMCKTYSLRHQQHLRTILSRKDRGRVASSKRRMIARGIAVCA
jgi:hypothetical protein